METCYSVPTKDLFHEDKEVLILLFQMFEVADITLFQLSPNVLSTYNCDFVRGDVPAGQSLPPLGHGAKRQGMVLSHHFCQDREVWTLVVRGVPWTDGRAHLRAALTCGLQWGLWTAKCDTVWYGMMQHGARWHGMAGLGAVPCRQKCAAAIILQQGEGVGHGATSITRTAGQDGRHGDTHRGSCMAGICAQLSLATAPGHWLSLAEAFAEWQLWCQDAAVCGVCERLSQERRLELTGLGGVAGLP